MSAGGGRAACVPTSVSRGISEKQLARVFDASPDHIAIVRAEDGRLIAANPAFERATGYRMDEIAGRSVAELGLWVIPGERERFLADLRVKGSLQDRQVLLRTRDGRVLCGSLSASLIEHDGEQLVISVMRDVTQAKRLERRARQSERKFAALFETSPIGLVVTRAAEQRVVEINDAALRLFGLAREEAVGALTTELIHLDPVDARAARVVRFARRDGTAVEALVSGAALEIDGEPHHVVSLLDVTEQRRVERERQQADARHRALFDAALDGMVITTPQGSVLDANAAACAMSGYSREELIGRSFAQLPRKHGGALEIEIVSGPMPDGNRLAIMRDVTERRRAEALVRQANASLERVVHERTAELEEANRELESYNFSVSHDLRQPLNAIAGFAELLQDGGTDTEECVREIALNAARMEQMIDALMWLSRAGRAALARSEVDMKALAESVAHDFSSSAASRAQVTIGDLPAACGDPVLLRQVWVNLVGNALKYSRNAAAPRVEIAGARRDGRLEYSVRDNGVGFDMRDATRLFGAFQRLRSAAGFEGSGIGLAIVQRILRRHGGEIHAESAPGKGATFRFSLPL
jgi:PAS domain S-box-containing protein